MKIDLTCPIEVVSVVLTPDGAGHVHAALKIRNIFDQEIRSLSGHAIWSSCGLSQRTDFSMDGMAFEPKAVIDMKLACAGMSGESSVDIFFDFVLACGSEPWTADPDRLREEPVLPRLTGGYINRLSRHAGDDAVCCAEAYDDGTWLCICGRLNLPSDTSCRRCGREMETTLRDYSPEAVDALPYIAKENDVSMPFDDDQDEPAPAANETKKTRRSYALTLLFFAVLFALAALGVRALRFKLTDAAGLMPTSFAEFFRLI